MGESTKRLARLPFADQCAHIEAHIERDHDLAALIAELAGLRDHQPLAHAVAVLAGRAMLDRHDVATALEHAFLQIPDTGMQRVLQSVALARMTVEQSRVLVRCVAAAVRALPLDRLAVVCLMDRWLKNNAPDVRAALVREAADEVRALLDQGQVDRISDETLLRLPGAELTRHVQGMADAALAVRLDARLHTFAGRVLDILEATPKSLSQANAEEILARRVYTDPGHFLVELLQNAEDAGATTWRVDVSDAAITVWHDGAPFDAKDVVGVLSIGQTTKRKDQIGFFGVGFKSVYDICLRPQVYSGPFCFEIADVSIPRRLDRPDSLEHGTLLVLRLHDPGDPLRSPAALFARALAVPPQTLLTLSSLRSMDVSHGPAFRKVRATRGSAPGRVRLVIARAGSEAHDSEAHDSVEYLVEADHFVCEGVARESARVSESPVLVGIALDQAGMPVPLPADAPTIFSYLPTRERSGLRFLLHAHFDLPVDRERLDLESPWNCWAIARAGELLARMARNLAHGGDAADEVVDGFIDVLPLAEDLAHPAYGALVDALRRNVAEVALLPGANGKRLSPSDAALTDDAALARALAGVNVTAQGRQLLAPDMPLRRQRVALSLGACRFALAELIDLMARTLAATGEGDAPPVAWLEPGYEIVMDALARASASAAIAADARLAALPLFLDDHGRLRRAASVACADAALRAVYGGARVFVHPCLDAHMQRNAAARTELCARLGVASLGPRDLIAELADPRRAHAIAGHGRAADVIAYLARLPAELTAALGAVAVFPAMQSEPESEQGQGHLRALVGPINGPDAAAWLVEDNALGAFVCAMHGRRPPLVDLQIAARHSDFLRALGGRVLGLAEFLDLLDSGHVSLPERDVLGFHHAIEAMRGDLTPRLCARLCRARVFRDRKGVLRPLCGADRALLTGDPDDRAIQALNPDVPWLDHDIAALEYVRALGADMLGPAQIAAELAGIAADSTGTGAGIVNLDDPASLRRAYGYLAARHQGIPGEIVAALARAAIWFDEHGRLRPLATLRRPTEIVSLRAVYRAWAQFPLIEDVVAATENAHGDEYHLPGFFATAALDLARALGLDGQVITPDHETLIRDVALAPAAETRVLIRQARAELVNALIEAAAEVPRAVLALLESAEIFRAEPAHERTPQPGQQTGQQIGQQIGHDVDQDADPAALYALARWSAPLSVRGVARALGPLRRALCAGSRPVLCRQDEEDLGKILDAMGVEPASVHDLIVAVERDPGCAGQAARHAARAALAELGRGMRPDELARETRDALQSVAVWPARDGRMLAASAVVRRPDLHSVLHPAYRTMDSSIEPDPGLERALGQGYALLDAAAEADAAALEHVISFRDPMDTIAALVEDLAIEGEPLAAQPALLADPVRVAEMFCVMGERGSSLPLSVNAQARLVRGRLYRAGDDELALCKHTRLFEDLAHPLWAERVSRHAPHVLEPPALRQVVAALADEAREACVIGARAHLAEAQARQHLYAWILAHGRELASDEQARGTLGRACVIATQGGYLRAPRALLLDASLPDLGIDWNAADEVPGELIIWLRREFAPEEKQLAPLVEHLLAAHERAAKDRDGARSEQILEVLARALRVNEHAGRTAHAEHAQNDDHASAAAAMVKRFRLRKRLRVEDSKGAFTRPRALLAPSPERWRLIVAFAAEPPARVSQRYDHAAVRALICLAGAGADLDEQALARYLDADGRRGGLDAELALARYVAELADENPSLRNVLVLDRRSWIPSRAGSLRRADQLYWPDSNLLVGDDPQLFPHPVFFHGAPPGIARWLRFRSAAEATLRDVAGHVRSLVAAGETTPEEVLAWLEHGLRRGAFDSAEVMSAFGDVAFIVDDSGRMRTPLEVVREGAAEFFGQRRGTWSAGRQYPRLAATLKISKQPGKREVVAYCQELLGEIESQGGEALLASEPGLIDTVPRCLALLAAAGGTIPARLPVAFVDARGATGLCIAPAPGYLYRREPDELVDAAHAAAAPMAFALAPLDASASPATGAGQLMIDTLLARLGVPDLSAAPPDVLPAAGAWVDARSEAEKQARDTEPAAQPSSRPRGRPADESRESPNQLDHVAAQMDRDDVDSDAHAERRGGQPGKHQGEQQGFLSRIRRWLATDAEDRDTDADRDADTNEERERPRERAPRQEPRPKRQKSRAKPKKQPRPAQHNASNRARSGADSARSPDAGAARPSTAGGVPDHSQWFRPRRRMGPQMGDNTAWAADRQSTPEFGMAFAPRSLPAPHVYAVKVLFDRFDPGSQRWSHGELPADWNQPAGHGRYQVEVRGRVPAGEVILPVPAYGRVVAFSTEPEARFIHGHHGQSILFASADCAVSYTVILDSAPAFEADFHAGAGPEIELGRNNHLLDPTVPDDELPAEVHQAVDRIQDDHTRPFDRALAVRDFIRERYYYDPAYIEDPTVGRWLHSISRGRGNAHIAAMHAGRDARYLGRGVCYELNTLACELMRRTGVPAAVAIGWTFDRGAIDEPDHLWAMGLVPTAAGPRWLPVDASTTRQGMPLHAGRRPPGPWRARPRKQRASLPRSPSWARGAGRHHDNGSGSEPAVPISDLVRVMRYVETLTGHSASTMGELRRRCREILRDPRAAAELLKLLGDDGP